MKYLKYILIFALFISAYTADAQRFTSKKRYWSAGVMLNGMSYFGDITPKENVTSFDISMTRPELGFYAMRRLFPRLSVRGSLSYGALRGDDFVSGDASSFSGTDTDPASNPKFFRAARNQHFRNRIAELSGTVVIDLIQNRGLFYKRPDKPIPYVFAGIAFGFHNPQAQAPTGAYQHQGNGVYEEVLYTDNTVPWTEDVAPGQWVNLKDYQTEGVAYSNLLVSIPFGIGVRYKLNDKLDIAFEAGYRWTFTDYLDDVSGRYIQHDNNSLAYYLSDRSLASSFNGESRKGLVETIHSYYGGDPSLYSQPIVDPDGDGIFPVTGTDGSNPGERRGDDGTPIYEPDNGKKGPFSRANDVYMVYGIHLSYIFANNVKCPKFK